MTMDPSQPHRHQQHTADESGGIHEAVYASDGLPPLAAPLPPPPLPPFSGVSGVDGGDGGGDDAIETGASPDPRAAFDAFDGAAAATTARDPRAPSSSMTWEDPRRRLLRLRSEVDDLERILLLDDGDDDGPRRSAASGGADDGTDGAVSSSRAAASELKMRIDALIVARGGSPEGEGGGLDAMLRGRQVDLSSVISRDVERLSAAMVVADASDASSGGKVVDGAGTSSSSSSGGGGRVVYELYREGVGAVGGNDRRGAAAPSKKWSANAPASPREAALEERLRNLELAVGSTSHSHSTSAGGGGVVFGGNNDGRSILERVREAEALVREVDASAIDRLAARAKVVRADLEAAARAKSKLSSSSSSATSRSGEDARTVSELHAAMLELDGVSAHLPALVSRLVELSGLHASAADFGTRLGAAEKALVRSEATLASVEEALSRMEGGWKENVGVVERNVDRLDGLLKSLNG